MGVVGEAGVVDEVALGVEFFTDAFQKVQQAETPSLKQLISPIMLIQLIDPRRLLHQLRQMPVRLISLH